MFNPDERKVKCKFMLKNQQIHDVTHFVRIGFCLKYLDLSNSGRFQNRRVNKVYKWRNTHTYFVFEDVKQVDSELVIDIVLDTRKVVKFSFVRQDQIPLNDLPTSMSTFNSIEAESDLTVLQASELAKEKLGLEHVRLWYIDYCQYSDLKPLMICDTQKDIGGIVLQQMICNRTDWNFFLEVSNHPIEEYSYLYQYSSYCLVYQQLSGDLPFRFVGSKIAAHSNGTNIDRELESTILDTAGVHKTLHAAHEVKYGVIMVGEKGFHIQWKRLVGGERSAITSPMFCLVCKK